MKLKKLLLVFLLWACTAWAGTTYYMIDYNPTCPNDSLPTFMAERATAVVGGLADYAALKAANPDLDVYFYDSPTDNKIPGDDHSAWVAVATEPESLYIHWTETTVFIHPNPAVACTTTGYAGDRVPTYLPTDCTAPTRFVVRFNNATARLEYANLIADLVPDTLAGLFSDNSSWTMAPIPTVLSGGHIQEGPYPIRSSAWQDSFWLWYRPARETFFEILADTLHARGQKLIRNIGRIQPSDTWPANDSFAYGDVGDIFFLEYDGNAQAANWSGRPKHWFSKGKLLDQQGKSLWLSPVYKMSDGATDNDTLSMVYSSWVVAHGTQYGSGIYAIQWNAPCLPRNSNNCSTDCADCGSSGPGTCCSPPCGVPENATLYFKKYWIKAVDELRTKFNTPTSDLVEVVPDTLYKRSYSAGEIYMWVSSELDSTIYKTLTFPTRYRLWPSHIDTVGIQTLKLPKGRAVALLKPTKSGGPPQEYEEN